MRRVRSAKRAPRLNPWIPGTLLAGIGLFVGLVQSDVLSLEAKRYCEPAVFAPSCYDGDTCTAYLGGRREDVRLDGFDTPEINGNARCAREHHLGLQARDRLLAMIGAARERSFCHRSHEDYKRDRYGRVLAKLELDGRDVGPLMIEQGLAVPFPLGHRPNWCG